MEHPGPRAARRGTLGQFGQIGLESRTNRGTQVTESGSSGSQGDPTCDPHVEKRGETVQTRGEKSPETKPEADQTHRATRQEKRTQGDQTRRQTHGQTGCQKSRHRRSGWHGHGSRGSGYKKKPPTLKNHLPFHAFLKCQVESKDLKPHDETHSTPLAFFEVHLTRSQPVQTSRTVISCQRRSDQRFE